MGVNKQKRQITNKKLTPFEQKTVDIFTEMFIDYIIKNVLKQNDKPTK